MSLGHAIEEFFAALRGDREAEQSAEAGVRGEVRMPVSGRVHGAAHNAEAGHACEHCGPSYRADEQK